MTQFLQNDTWRGIFNVYGDGIVLMGEMIWKPYQ